MSGRVGASPERVLSRQQARRFYDRFGGRQDRQAWYEDRALAEMVGHAALQEAGRVVELGSGTGRLARRLLERHLPAEAHYVGLDLSSTMVRLARDRLTPFSDRTSVVRTDGSLALPLADASCDRFLSSYVVDLLSASDIDALLLEAHRVLAPDGLLGLVSLTEGPAGLSRLVSGLWASIQSLSPRLVGGCRPVELLPYLDEKRWALVHRQKVVTRSIPSEVVVARRREPAAAPS